MNYNETYINSIFNECSLFINSLDYSNELKDLLIVTIPAFILKYGYNNKKYIFDMFKKTRIIINDTGNSKTPAYYRKIPMNNGNNIIIENYIIIQNMDNIIELIDSIVHEFNHAINSIRNEFYIKDGILYIRVGLMYFEYKQSNLEFIKRNDNYILEEIINTKEAEEIIDIINNFKNYSSLSFNSSILYYLNNHIKNTYKSDAYYNEILFTNSLVNNKTFLSNMNRLRFEGCIDDVEYWFNNITGNSDSYNNMIHLLLELRKIQENKKLSLLQKITFKKRIRKIYIELNNIIELFNSNCNFR